jgi:hypothetical protein
MKNFSFFLCLVIAIIFTNQEVVLNNHHNQIVPESNKVLIDFGQFQEPISIASDHAISNINTTYPIQTHPLAKNAEYLSELSDRNIYGNSNSLFDPAKMNHLYNDNHVAKNEETLEDLRNNADELLKGNEPVVPDMKEMPKPAIPHETPEELADISHHEIPDGFENEVLGHQNILGTDFSDSLKDAHENHENEDEEEEYEFEDKDCRYEDCTNYRKINQAYVQLGDLKNELEQSLKENEEKTPVLLNGNSIKTIISYLKHLDYINKREHGFKIDNVPELPENEDDVELIKLHDHTNYAEQLKNEKLELDKKGEDLHLRRESLNQAINDLTRDIEEFQKEDKEKSENVGVHEEEILNLESEKQKLLEEMETIENETFDIKTSEEIAEQIERVDSIEHEAAEENKTDEVKALESEKEKLEIIEENAHEKIKKEQEILDIEDRLETINEDEKLLEPGSEVVEVLENEKHELIKKEKVLEEELADNSDLTHDHSHVDESVEKEESSEEVHKKSEEEKEKSEEENSIEEHIEYTPEEQQAMEEQEYKIHDLGHSENFDHHWTESTNYQHIHEYLEIIKSMQTGYIGMFERIPDSTADIPENPEDDMDKGIEIFNHLRKFVVSVHYNLDNLKKDVKYIIDQIEHIELSQDELIDYYGYGDEYDKVVLEVDHTDHNYIQKYGLLKDNIDQTKVDFENVLVELKNVQEYNDLINHEIDFIKKDMDDGENSVMTINEKV